MPERQKERWLEGGFSFKRKPSTKLLKENLEDAEGSNHWEKKKNLEYFNPTIYLLTWNVH